MSYKCRNWWKSRSQKNSLEPKSSLKTTKLCCWYTSIDMRYLDKHLHGWSGLWPGVCGMETSSLQNICHLREPQHKPGQFTQLLPRSPTWSSTNTNTAIKMYALQATRWPCVTIKRFMWYFRSLRQNGMGAWVKTGWKLNFDWKWLFCFQTFKQMKMLSPVLLLVPSGFL